MNLKSCKCEDFYNKSHIYNFTFYLQTYYMKLSITDYYVFRKNSSGYNIFGTYL